MEGAKWGQKERREWRSEEKGHSENGRNWELRSGESKKGENAGRRGVVRIVANGSCEGGKARKVSMEEQREGV